MEIASTASYETLDAHDVLAVVLSVFLPGLGHIMLDQRTKGLVILAAVIASCGVGYIVSVLIAVDAYLVARVRKERAVADFECFPEHERHLGI
jgi:TM2 domain-containing membrane protein YozV